MNSFIHKKTIPCFVFIVASMVNLMEAREVKADYLNVSASAKSVSSTACDVTISASAKLGPFSANANFGPVRVQKLGPCFQQQAQVGPIFFKVRACASNTRVTVTVTTWTYVFGKKVELKETKSVSISS